MKPASLAITAVLLTVIIGIGALFAWRLVQVFPLENDVTDANSLGDDWLVYHRYALSVLTDGLTMPIVREGFFRPAGFAYPYVIALIYAAAGVRSEAVYVVQAILLAVSVAGMWALFRTRASPLVALTFLAALAGVMYLDVFRTLTFRLLAENLVFPLWPALLFFALRGESAGRAIDFLAAGAISGLCFLTRGNLLAIGPVMAAVVWRFPSKTPQRLKTRSAVALLIGWIAVSSLLPIRNFAVTGELDLTVITQPTDWSLVINMRRTELTIVERTSRLVSSYAARVSYLLGVPHFLQPTFRVRPHWLVLWSGFFWYLRGLSRRAMAFWEGLVLSAVAAYFIPILLLGYVSSYATRTPSPGLPLVLLLACKGLDISLRRESSAHLAVFATNSRSAPSVPA